LDAGRYRALLDALEDEVPQMYLQVTSETAGRYSGPEQRAMMRRLGAANVSVGLREMVRTPDDWAEARDFYHWSQTAGVNIQHILYSPAEVATFVKAYHAGDIPQAPNSLLFVQGTYANGAKDAVPLEAYLAPLTQAGDIEFEWMACAFGQGETDSLVRAAQLGGKTRVGFENSLWHRDGSLAKDNAERIAEVDAAIRASA
jgi:uncharacterized protein (DUF849 family)